MQKKQHDAILKYVYSFGIAHCWNQEFLTMFWILSATQLSVREEHAYVIDTDIRRVRKIAKSDH